MKISIPGNVLLIVLYSFIFVIFSFFSIGQHKYISDYYAVLDETRDFVDKVIDTKQISDRMLEDYNLALSSHNSLYKAEIIREIKVVNPDPVNPGKTVTTYVVSDNNREFNSGDFVTVTVFPISHSIYQTISQVFFHINPNDAKIVKSGMIGR